MDLRKCLEDLIIMYDNDVCCGIENDEERKKLNSYLEKLLSC